MKTVFSLLEARILPKHRNQSDIPLTRNHSGYLPVKRPKEAKSIFRKIRAAFNIFRGKGFIVERF